MRRPAATMGEHNEYAALDLAEISQSEYMTLLNAGVMRTMPPE
tara:strand:- start:306 stop:434 length:129 start_codon:yes stop_codon:yes gene_type:complete